MGAKPPSKDPQGEGFPPGGGRGSGGRRGSLTPLDPGVPFLRAGARGEGEGGGPGGRGAPFSPRAGEGALIILI